MKGDLEPLVAKQLVESGIYHQYESEKLKYTLSSNHNYIPDFIVTTLSKKTIYLEVKGYLRPADRRKMLAVKEQHPDKDIRFVFKHDNKINSKSKTRYSDWCKKNGFKYCLKGIIPEDWFE